MGSAKSPDTIDVDFEREMELVTTHFESHMAKLWLGLVGL